MNAVELMFGLKKRMYDGNIDLYRKKFFHMPLTGNDKDESSEAIRYFQSLPPEGQEKIFSLVKTVLWDDISEFCGWLQGSFFIEGQTKDVELKMEGEDKKLNEYLGDIWINMTLEGYTKEELERDFVDI